ncbi:hypothetical protein Tcan_05992 [Toxocara canis]|uniref:Domain of unknown function DB domain-containing protein n=1 Tax=Toxocara canis TaxID=6265 RepID=A0A0B2VK99_TOXCA|nr:hypothetical protein Tcan_05992 [Toxocara canis]
MHVVHLTLLFTSLLLGYFETAEACMGVGGCGGGCGRCCARARGSKTLSVSRTFNGSKQFGERNLNLSPDEEFLECCKDARLPPTCFNKCSYSNYNEIALRNMFFGMDACPIQAANDIHFCATRSVDHRQCCARNGVTTTIAGNKCLIFCAPPSQNETRLDFSFMPCYERFESMKSCFWKSAVEHSQYQQLQPIETNRF